ncbi:hypothetical protein SYN63AY4M2_00665 [Synechococcus sp. 63AY4M2]|nr:hypothetical protein SYN63AY4M2_00665 [Synechococcus sp. 63AY4M2]PIK89700.1 hypothetical protein SYN65AY6A5_04340 [Synechococcus sp. 65AY6A5]PIK93263.1 hypothetical protein SYN65AY6LI_11530 [Synechococcus sp. 65AY6Li]PIK96344.1 hypothetical protein SYN60AY4M2_01115 [Synechococcus sp. 60AY4M2]PIK99185.1 hypothetical protein SYN63AY4M1_12055 [Synechococcus sp. 63AY4M1]PIL02374.1 hypothetical protein SYN65AY640_02005 [Synechococcus sp. 65AY640]
MAYLFGFFGFSILNSPLPLGEGLGVRATPAYSSPGIRFDLCP